jgi:hypothetical protein
MPVETRWLIEKRVCYQRVFGDTTLEDVIQTIEAAEHWASEGVPPVHFIVDVAEVKTYPPLMNMLRVLRPTSFPNVAWSVLVVRHPQLRFIATMLTQLTGKRYHTVATVEAALQFLASQDISLPTSTTL